MIADKSQSTNDAAADVKDRKHPDNEPSDLILCVDEAGTWRSSIRHAKAVASSFGGKVVLVKVIEPPNNHAAPLDPVDWEIRKRAAQSNLDKIAKEFDSEACVVTTQTLEGNTVARLRGWCSNKPRDIAVVSGRGGGRRWTERHNLASLIDLDTGTILMVPAGADISARTRYRRIFVPLDGSAIAETAIPKAIALAKHHQAELVVCHITPNAGITSIGPADDSADDLKKQIHLRNKRVGKNYLTRIRNRLKDCGVPVITDFIEGGDVRRALLQAAIQKHAADLMVIASHGQTGQMDVPTGHVTSFVLDHSSIPVLMVRQRLAKDSSHFFSGVLSEGVRPPSSTKE